MTKVLYFLRSNVSLPWPLNSFLTCDKARYLHNLIIFTWTALLLLIYIMVKIK